MILQDQVKGDAGAVIQNPTSPTSIAPVLSLQPTSKAKLKRGSLMKRWNGGKELNKVTKDQVSAWEQATKIDTNYPMERAVTQLSHWAAGGQSLLSMGRVSGVLQRERKPREESRQCSLVRWDWRLCSGMSSKRLPIIPQFPIRVSVLINNWSLWI